MLCSVILRMSVGISNCGVLLAGLVPKAGKGTPEGRPGSLQGARHIVTHRRVQPYDIGCLRVSAECLREDDVLWSAAALIETTLQWLARPRLV